MISAKRERALALVRRSWSVELFGHIFARVAQLPQKFGGRRLRGATRRRRLAIKIPQLEGLVQ
jgi:hypothetical protein